MKEKRDNDNKLKQTLRSRPDPKNKIKSPHNIQILK